MNITKRTLIEGYEVVTEPYVGQAANDAWLDVPRNAWPPVVGTRRAIRAELDSGAVILWPLCPGDPEPTDADLLDFEAGEGGEHRPDIAATPPPVARNAYVSGVGVRFGA